MTSGRHVCLDKTKPDMTNIDKTSKYYCTIPQMTMDPENFRSRVGMKSKETIIWFTVKPPTYGGSLKWGYHVFLRFICNGKSYKPMDALEIPIFFGKPPKTTLFASNWHSPSSVISCMQCHLSTFTWCLKVQGFLFALTWPFRKLWTSILVIHIGV